MSTFTGSTLTHTIVRDTSPATTYSAQSWTVDVPCTIQVESFTADIRSAGSYDFKINGSTVASVSSVSAASSAVVFTLGTPLVLSPGSHTFSLTCGSSVLWYSRGNLNPFNSTVSGTGALYLGMSVWTEPAANFVPGTIGFKIADGTRYAGVDYTSLSGSSFAAQTWSITFDTAVKFTGLLKRLYAADTSGYVLTIDAGSALATVTKNTGTTEVVHGFIPASVVPLTTGAHTFKLTPSASRRWFYTAGTGTGPTGDSHTTAWGTWGESTSNQVSARIFYTLPEVPGVPTSVVATPGYTDIDLDWAIPATGDPATGYDVRINGGTPVDVGNVLTYTFTSLTPATSYTLEVRGYNAVGDGGWESVGATTGSPPGIPTSVSATDIGADFLELTWSAPVTGGAVTSYEVRLDGGSASTATSPHTFTSLSPGTSYTLEVRAVGPGGSSSWVTVMEETLPGGPDVAYAAKIRIGSHFWDIEFGDPADLDDPEILAGATFNWTAADDVGWPPPMWTVPRDVCQLRVRCPDASEIADVRRGDVVRFKFTPEGYLYTDPLVDFAGIITADPTITDDRGAGVILSVTASDYRVLLTNFTVIGETIIALDGVDTIGDGLTTLSDAIDVLADGQFPGAFGDVTDGAVDPRGFLAGTIDYDVIVPEDGLMSAMTLFAKLGMVPVPVYDDDGDLDPVQPFKIVEPDPYGETYDTPPAITAAIVPNSSVSWKRDYVPNAVEAASTPTGYLWMGGTPGDLEHATILRLSNLDGFNQFGFSNMTPEEEPWSLYVFLVLAYLNPEAPRDWFVYPQRVQQYVTINNAELVKNPSGTETVAGMLKGATLVVGPRGRWTVQAGLRNHRFDVPGENPNVPTSVVATPSTTSISLTWGAPSGGGTVTHYECNLDWAGATGPHTSPTNFVGLTSSTSYTVAVRAVGPGGNSAWVSHTLSTL